MIRALPNDVPSVSLVSLVMGVGYRSPDRLPGARKATPPTVEQQQALRRAPKKTPCTYAGQKTWGEPNMYKDNSGNLTRVKQTVINDEKIAGNVFTYEVGSRKTGDIAHPAMFPYELATDHIATWSNPGDLVLDPFSGSGTTAKAAKELGRRFLGLEINPEYCAIAERRIAQQVLELEAV